MIKSLDGVKGGWGSVLVKAPQDPGTVQKNGHPWTADFLYSFEGPPPQKCAKLPVREDPG